MDSTVWMHSVGRQGDGCGTHEGDAAEVGDCTPVSDCRHSEPGAGRDPPARAVRVTHAAAIARPGHQHDSRGAEEYGYQGEDAKRLAQEGQREGGDLQRLGLGIRDNGDEGALAHGEQHRRRGCHLRQ